MIVRSWTAQVDASRIDDYERFAAVESLPMFRAQPVILGVLFTRDGSTCNVISIWEAMADVEALSRSKTYERTVERIMSTGFVVRVSPTTLVEVHGGWLSDELAETVNNRR